MFSDYALKYYNQKGNTKYTKNDIKWIVTVPVIWNEYGKQFMTNCPKKAGMNKVLSYYNCIRARSCFINNV